MEKLGVPTAVICTEHFISSGKAIDLSHDIQDYPFIVIPHPIVATKTETLHEWADQVVDQVIALLLKGN
jgi:hypothetical protein